MSELKELFVDIAGWENNKVSRTIKGLTLTPAKTIQKFCDGDRDSFLHPVTYLVTIISLFVFIGSFVPDPILNELNVDTSEMISKASNLDPKSNTYKAQINAAKAMQLCTNALSSSYMHYFMAFLYTLLHLFFFKKTNYRLKDNVWFSIFTGAHITLLSIVAYAFYWSYTIFNVFGWLLNIVMIAYRTWACIDFYQVSWKKSLKKNLLMYLVSFIILMFLFIISFVILIFVGIKFNAL